MPIRRRSTRVLTGHPHVCNTEASCSLIIGTVLVNPYPILSKASITCVTEVLFSSLFPTAFLTKKVPGGC